MKLSVAIKGPRQTLPSFWDLCPSPPSLLGLLSTLFRPREKEDPMLHVLIKATCMCAEVGLSQTISTNHSELVSAAILAVVNKLTYHA
eukprot:603192-Amphidinium_carterae.1